MAVPLVFRVSVLLTCVNDHSAGRRLDYSSCDGINNERGHYLNRDGIIKVGRSFLRLSGTPLPLSPSHQTPTLLLHLESLSDNCGEALGLSKPKKKKEKNASLLSFPLTPRLAGQWVSIRAWPSCRLATSILALAKTIMTGLQRKWIPVSAPLRCAPLPLADGVLPWEAIIAGCQLTAPFPLPVRSALVLGLSLGK